MKKLCFLVLFISLMIASCKNSPREEQKDNEVAIGKTERKYENYGEEIGAIEAISALEMEQAYKVMKPGDTVRVAFTSKVEEVCKSKGCWMTLALPENEESVMVKFKDYEFFVPKDIEEKEVVINGKAFVSEVSVEEQQHLAKDGGKSEEEIARITAPKRTLSFIADGVMIAQDK